jgi:hypothetical protein
MQTVPIATDVCEFVYQSGSQNPYIEEAQTTQWSKEKNTKGQTRI